MISFVGKSIRPLIEDFNHCDEMKEALVFQIRTYLRLENWTNLMIEANYYKKTPQ